MNQKNDITLEFPKPRDAWDALSMKEKAEMIGVAVRNGITNLNDIRDRYNEFAEGENIYSGDEEETQQMEVSRSPHVDLAISNPWLYQKLHPASREEEVYEPSTFAGRVAQLAGVDELGQKYTDYTSSTIQQFPVVGTAISAADLGYDLNRLYHNPSLTTTKDVTLDAASLVPALRKTMKGWWMKGNSGSFITEAGQIINNPRVASTLEVALQPFRTAINTGVYGARAADFLDDSKAYLKEMYNSSKIGKHFPIKALGGPLVEAAMNEYKKGGSIHISPSKKGTFTAAAKKHGKSVQAFASQVLAHPENYSPAMRKKANFARNARKWKHGLGGNLFYPGGEITYGKPFFSYDENGQKIDDTLNYNATIPEVVIIPDSKKTPVQRNEDGRFRRRSLRDYDESKSKEFTAKQVLQSQKDWENSFEKQALNYAQTAATGIGIGADIVSGLPVYSSLKGASVLNRVETPMNYVEGGLWLAPVLGGAYQTAKPTVRQALNLFKTDSPFSDWVGITQHNISDTTKPSGLQETQQAAERGRNKLLDWVKSSFYKQRIEEEPFYRFSNDIVNEASSLVENAPLGFDKTVREIHPSGQITGETVTRPALKIKDDGYRVFDLNTGLDVNIGSDLGNEAEDVTLHELLHYLTVNSKGIPESTSTMQIVDKGWMQPLEALFNPVGKNILRGKKWQSYILDQNDALLPKYDTVVDMVMHRPEEAKAALLKAGRTEAEADVAIKSLKDRYEYWSDIQEQRAHLQELFISKIKPHLKNPNDAAEIEAFLTQHPDILESSSPYNFIQEVRPGSLKQYSKYFASALGTLPFIITNNNE